MSKAVKIWLIAAASLTFLGLAVFVGSLITLNFDLTNLSTAKYETSEHNITESYKNIYIDSRTADITFLAAEEDTTSVVCYEHKNQRYSVSVNDGTLSIKLTDTRRWYEHIGISWDAPKITVYMPKSEYTSLVINESTGDIDVPKSFRFESIDISASTGDVTLGASASGNVRIETDTGDIGIQGISAGALDLCVSTGTINVSSVICESEIEIEVSTGEAMLTDVSCASLESEGDTGDITLENVIATGKFSIERSTGYVKLKKCDADTIFIETDTGDVKGTLLSDKVFFAQSDTGKISVPKSTIGGSCEIQSDTGNIDIEIIDK